jgi:DNA polymerase-3 subunit gamma/tau
LLKKAEGTRDVLSIFDRVVSFPSGKDLTCEVVTENLNVLDYDSYFTMTDLLLIIVPGVINAFNIILEKVLKAIIL